MNGEVLNNLMPMETNPPPGFGAKSQHYSPPMGHRQMMANHGNIQQEIDHLMNPISRAITGKQQNLLYSEGEAANLQNSSRGLLHGSMSSLHSSGAGLHNSQSNLQSSSASLHGSGHMTRKSINNHFMDNNALSRQIAGGFSSSGSFREGIAESLMGRQEGMSQGLIGRQLTAGLSASFQEKASLHHIVTSSASNSGFIDSGPILNGSRHNSRSDLASLSGRW